MGLPAVTFVTPAEDLVEQGEGGPADIVVGAGHRQAHGADPRRLDGAAVPAGQSGQLGDCLGVLALTEGDVQRVFEDEPHCGGFDIPSQGSPISASLLALSAPSVENLRRNWGSTSPGVDKRNG